jgi:hypothetical protein
VPKNLRLLSEQELDPGHVSKNLWNYSEHNWLLWYNWNIVENGTKHHNNNSQSSRGGGPWWASG